MSRTKRKIRKGTYKQDGTRITKGGDAQVSDNWLAPRKMTPYTKKGLGDYKMKPARHDSPGGFKGITSYEKLITKNANRSKKKAYRQKLKKELKDELQFIPRRRQAKDTL